MPHGMSDLARFWVHDTVSALVYSLARAHSGSGTTDLAGPYNDLTQFVLRQHSQMPDYLRRPMLAATGGFDLSGIFRSGRQFHSRPPDVRQKQVAAWKHSKLNFQRDFIR